MRIQVSLNKLDLLISMLTNQLTTHLTFDVFSQILTVNSDFLFFCTQFSDVMRLLICCYLIAKLISSAQITNCNLMHQRNFIIVHLMASLFYAKWPKDTSIFTIHVAFTTYFGLLLCDTLSNLQFNLPDKDFLSLFKRQKEKIVGTWGRCRSTLKRASLSVTNLFIFSQLFFAIRCWRWNGYKENGQSLQKCLCYWSLSSDAISTGRKWIHVSFGDFNCINKPTRCNPRTFW